MASQHNARRWRRATCRTVGKAYPVSHH